MYLLQHSLYTSLLPYKYKFQLQVSSSGLTRKTNHKHLLFYASGWLALPRYNFCTGGFELFCFHFSLGKKSHNLIDLMKLSPDLEDLQAKEILSKAFSAKDYFLYPRLASDFRRFTRNTGH